MSNFVSFLFLIKDKCKKGQGTDKNLDGNESEEAEIEEVKNLFIFGGEKESIWEPVNTITRNVY